MTFPFDVLLVAGIYTLMVLIWAGIIVAIVAPIWKVMDLLERDDLVEQRTRRGLDLERSRGTETAVSQTAVDAS